MIGIKIRTRSQGDKQEKMKLKTVCPHSFTSIIFLLGFLILLCEPKSTHELCVLKKNGTHAYCHYLGDIKFINTYGLDSLKVLSVGKHLHADTFGNLTSLKHLDLSNGALMGIESKAFQNLHNLRSINLSNNHLNYLKSGTLNGLNHLHTLNLSKNFFDHIPSDIIELKHLKHLDLSRNEINCDCKTLKQRDALLKSGLEISKNTVCSGLHNLGEKLFIEPDADVTCIFDEQDSEEFMLRDQPVDEKVEGSGEGSGDAFDDIEAEDIPDDDEEPIHHSLNVTTSNSATSIETTSTFRPETTTSSDDELFFTEETEESSLTSPATTLVETSTKSIASTINVSEKISNKEWETEGSGDVDAEGSGFEGSGIGIVPPIIWESVETTVSHEENENSSTDEGINSRPTPSATTESEGIVDSIYKFLWGQGTPVETTTSSDLNLEEEQFILASSTSQEPEHKKNDRVDEEIISPSIINSEVEKTPDSGKGGVLDDSKSGKVQVETSLNDTESPDASATKQSKKTTAPYIVLGTLLGVLGALIGFAAYRSDFCKSKRKRNNNNHPSSADIETGTELKDMTKSLLDKPNSVQPKISPSNGEKIETVPLVTSSGIPTEIKNDDEPMARYNRELVNESTADPVKPPRKSFLSNNFEDGKINEKNGKIVATPELSYHNVDDHTPIRKSKEWDIVANDKNDRDSLSSIGGESQLPGSQLSNPRLSQDLPPASPHAQRVKITLQENPDSVPKTPLLITRTKAGENLVKTP